MNAALVRDLAEFLDGVWYSANGGGKTDMQRTVDSLQQDGRDTMQGMVGSVLPQLKELAEIFDAFKTEFESKLSHSTELVRTCLQTLRGSPPAV